MSVSRAWSLVDEQADRIADLEERVAWLESELRLTRDAGRIDALRVGLGVTPAEARMLLALAQARGVIRIPTLAYIVSPRCEESAGDKVVCVHVCHIRARLGPGLIRNAWGDGYAITPAGADLVREALGE